MHNLYHLLGEVTDFAAWK